MTASSARTAIGLIIALLLVTRSYAQFSVEPRLATMYDDNIYNNYLRVSDKIASLSLTGGYEWEQETWNTAISYDGNVNFFEQNTDRNNQFHSLVFSYARYYGEDGENILQTGLSYGKGYYSDEYTLFDHSLLTASIDYKGFIEETIIQKYGYAFHEITLAELGEFNYTEHVVYGNVSFSLPTQTTLIVQADAGTKFYHSSDDSISSGDNTSSLTPDVTQLKGLFRIGQSVAEGTGASATAQYLWNIQKQNRYLISSSGALSDDELFDDHYGYEGLHANLMLTHYFDESVMVKLTGGLQQKLYSSLPAFDVDGNQIADLRSDRRSYLAFLVQKTFESGLGLSVGYDYIRNSSNDLMYDYTNNAFMVELEFPL